MYPRITPLNQTVYGCSRYSAPQSQRPIWSSVEGGFSLSVYYNGVYAGLEDYYWDIDFGGNQWVASSTTSYDKAVNRALRYLAKVFGVDVAYLRDLMEFEMLMNTLASIGE